MNCPRPDCDTTGQVIETRVRPDGLKRRRYQCAKGHRFSTLEQIAQPNVATNGKRLETPHRGEVRSA